MRFPIAMVPELLYLTLSGRLYLTFKCESCNDYHEFYPEKDSKYTPLSVFAQDTVAVRI